MAKRKDFYYFIRKNGRSIQVSKEEWEKSWLDWYMRTKKNKQE